MTLDSTNHQKFHDYHLVSPSPLPIITAFSLLFLLIGVVLSLHHHFIGHLILPIGIVLVITNMYLWWKTVIHEGRDLAAHSKIVQRGLSIGMALFILSEVMFFFVFFWSFFKASLDPVHILDGVWPAKVGIWPPAGIHPFNPWDIPLMNTLVLLLSGTTVTWAHHAMLENNKKDMVQALLITVLLGLSFTGLQAYEYIHAPFKFNHSIYSSNFYMATGFHGFHVIIGTIFLAVCYFRAKKGDFEINKGHLGMEFAAWYWHFVDVIWLFLFIFVYVFGR